MFQGEQSGSGCVLMFELWYDMVRKVRVQTKIIVFFRALVRKARMGMRGPQLLLLVLNMLYCLSTHVPHDVKKVRVGERVGHMEIYRLTFILKYTD